MTDVQVLDIFRGAIYNILIMSAPMLISALLVGLVISIFQATTQIQEQTLAFVPKVLAIFLVLMFAGPWLMNTIVTFALSLYDQIPGFVV
jgi:flagellar biosynthetic protein FliQ